MAEILEIILASTAPSLYVLCDASDQLSGWSCLTVGGVGVQGTWIIYNMNEKLVVSNESHDRKTAEDSPLELTKWENANWCPAKGQIPHPNYTLIDWVCSLRSNYEYIMRFPV